MSNLVTSLLPAANGARSTVSAGCSEVISNSYSETVNAAAEEMNSSHLSSTCALTQPYSLGVNSVCSSLYRDSSVVDEASALTSSLSMIHDQLAEGTIDSMHLTPALDEPVGLGCKVASSAVEPVDGLLRGMEEQCRSDTVTFNVPLEVIGACWFMKRDTETCLQATTANDGLFL